MVIRNFLAMILFCTFSSGVNFATYYGQNEQDKIIYENYFYGHKSGCFIDIGAYDGVSLNSTYFFEKELGWRGICIEPLPERFCELEKNRSCLCIRGCVGSSTETAQFLRITSPSKKTEMLSGLVGSFTPDHMDKVERDLTYFGGSSEVTTVQCYNFNDIITKNGIYHVNVLNINANGAEFEILANIDFSHCLIDIIVVEDYYNDPNFINFLHMKGFKFEQRIGKSILFSNFKFKKTVNKWQ